jgi:hypothetical protein
MNAIESRRRTLGDFVTIVLLVSDAKLLARCGEVPAEVKRQLVDDFENRRRGGWRDPITGEDCADVTT